MVQPGRELPDAEGPLEAPAIVVPIEQYSVNSWTPEPNGQGKCTQVHMLVELKDFPHPFAIRFKSADAINTLIGALERHRDHVFGEQADGS